ncbi:MAG: thioredoxin-dependent thiol peroxidase [Alphaproteobacteria bacterium]|jgi:peroxiredoxin Q/BCP|nr:thioredoxin-dependent thiol peroxidase [Alphaproteobacteria bacterium]MBP9867395.1 thioredoxin-dependent thiol peroxidase [Alphaproteobacteria bacterium]
MTHLKSGDAAPFFDLSCDTGAQCRLSDFAGKYLVVYFYPKDDTPGCTKESCSFNESLGDLQKINAQVVGISRDSVESHQKFKAKYNLSFPLLSDDSGEVCNAYGVWAEKSMYGKKYMGIERSTFLIDGTGKILRVWSNVKVDGHSEEILAAIKEFNGR